MLAGCFRLILTSLIVFFEDGSAKQVAFASIMSLVFLSMHYKFRPYITESENRLMTFCLWNCCIIYLYGFLVLNGEDSPAFSIIVIVLNVSVLLWFIFGSAFYNLLGMWSKREQYCNQIKAFFDGDQPARSKILDESMARNFMFKMDADGDGDISKEEFLAVAGRYGFTARDFDEADADGGGSLDHQEMWDNFGIEIVSKDKPVRTSFGIDSGKELKDELLKEDSMDKDPESRLVYDDPLSEIGVKIEMDNNEFNLVDKDGVLSEDKQDLTPQPTG